MMQGIKRYIILILIFVLCGFLIFWIKYIQKMDTRNNISSIDYAIISDKREIFKQLIDSGAKADKYSLHYASKLGRVWAIRELLKMEVDIESRDIEGNTALHLSSSNNRVLTTEFLINSGSDIEALNNRGCTPLHLACIYNALEAVKLLIEKGSNPNRLSYEGFSALHYAILYGDSRGIEMVKFLLKNGADVNQLTSDKRTVLHLLAGKNSHYPWYLELVKILLDNGARVEIKDKKGLTPVDIAKEKGKRELADMMLNYRCNIRN